MEEYNPFSLKGKTILVTGASSGIGRATAIECSRMGANIIATGRNEVRLNETLSMLNEELSNVAIVADLNNDEDMDNLVKSCPVVDGCVFCAGRGMTLPLQFSSPDKFSEIYQTNLFSPVELMRRLYKTKKISKGGSIVFIASIGGNYRFTPGNSVYGSAKAALNAITKYCAYEFAPRLIRANSICPGMVETPLIHGGTISSEQLAEDAKRYPLKRYGKPEEVALLAIYLLSDASAWVTGDSIRIDGGVAM